eukprot:11731401-Alexandrium_andersonii.AAC.1
MLAMRGHGPRADAWHVLGATPSVSRVVAFHTVRSIFNSVSLQSMRPRDGWDTPRVLHRARR